MKRSLIISLAVLCATPLSAQVLDSLLLNCSIFDLLDATGPMGNRVELHQPQALKNAVQSQSLQNESKTIQGYRVRIYSSNVQTARDLALAKKAEFEALFPWVRAYFNYVNIDFRVMVGDFRTRSEAMRFHKELTTHPAYKGAVIVREAIDFPPL